MKLVYRREQLKARVEFLYVKESSWFYLSASILFCQFLLQYMSHWNTPKCRPLRVQTVQTENFSFFINTCLPLHLWLHIFCSKYKIAFNMSEGLLFITKEVTGSQHRKFVIQLFWRTYWISDWIQGYGQRNSLKTINVDGKHFIRFRGKCCVFKFIRLSVDVASVCTVCTLRGLCFGVTDSLYSNVTCSVRETDLAKSTQANKAKNFL